MDEACLINDKRGQDSFKRETFSGFQKGKVKIELINSLIREKIEPACYWSTELICAGHFADLWECIINFVGKHIHLGNPKLPIYIALRFNNFKEILCKGEYLSHEIDMRNNNTIRQLFAEIISVVCFSRKKYSFESVKINKENDFDVLNLSSRLVAPSVNYANEFFKPNDPTELFIAINEFSYHISEESKNSVSACYWLEWILEYELICKSKKENCLGEIRLFPPIQDKYRNDIIWILWDILLTDCKKKNNSIMLKIITALMEIFSIKYSTGVKRKRKYLIYFAIALLIEPVDYKIEIFNNKPKIDSIVKKIDIIYKDIKKNEFPPDPENNNNLLGETKTKCKNKEQTTLEKTLKKLEKMNELNLM